MIHNHLKLNKQIAAKLALFVCSAAIFNFNKIIELPIPSLASFDQTETASEISWTSNQEFSKGTYYLSIGRAQGSCKLFSNNTLIDSNAGTSQAARSGLLLGAKIHLDESGPLKLQLNCMKLEGNRTRLIHTPYINTYRTGILVHLFRVFTDQLLPCIAMLLIFLYLAYAVDRNKRLPPEAIFTSAFAFLYITSLCNIYYLFLDNLSCMVIHSILKVGFVFSSYAWIFGRKKVTRGLLASALFATMTFLLALSHGSNLFLHTYTIFVNLVPFVGYISLLWIKAKPDELTELLTIIVPISIFSALDCFSWAGNGLYFSTATSFSIFALATYKYVNLEKAKNISRKAVAILASKQLEQASMIESLKQITMVISECLKFSNWSIYVDSYVLGLSPRPGRELRRLTSSDIRERSKITLISLEDDSGYGSLMKQSILSKHPIIKYNPRTRGTGIVIPIGETGCLNVSTNSTPKFDEEFIKTFIEESHPQINAIALTMMKVESTAALSTNLLKEELGVGTHNLEFGAIFADAVGYTQNIKSTKSFIEFFEREYIPSLLRNLDKKVILKDLFGDELYLVVLPKELSSTDAKNIHETTLEMVQLITDFSLGSGAELCQAAGYKPIEFKIGANAGPGQIVVSHSNVALSGPVIEAKRCLGRARASEPFITGELIRHASENIRDTSVKEIYAAKKEILVGYRISRHDKAA